MGRLIVSAQVTLDGVTDPEQDWMDFELHPTQHRVEQVRRVAAATSTPGLVRLSCGPVA